MEVLTKSFITVQHHGMSKQGYASQAILRLLVGDEACGKLVFKV